MLKRDNQGRFTLKNDDYRLVRSLRLTDDTWKALGMIAESLSLSRADYLEHLVQHNLLPSITREPELPCASASNQVNTKLENLRDRVLSELKLGKQASGYKVAQKVLDRFISEFNRSV